ncbi:phospholipase/Carboxylesterase [Leptothrix cholodnii SP-6]|uniref:Phospholipase/Carboxylesterase n=1 Tax=Leptothrix cholodnii (strain ATCC 51168 / LMG 8142 / SP-6) TaxID=395495 RepID=B1Y184_LEPCP|nr:esterase [Leptothrix cholodnii]ACB33061.1 phospholipase/Carboxylesterase [Leptothrix cholodnii SP-6]
MQEALILHRPATAATQLVLLFHGVGSSPENLGPLGQALAVHRPQACIVSVRSPDASDFGSGWQWFSVQGVTEANRPDRVAATMSRFVATVQHWQQETGLSAAATTLLGFSQGAIMALESTQQPTPLAARIVAIAGRYAQPPRVAPASTQVHLMHGDADPVMPVRLSVDALAQLQGLGAQATLDRFPGLGHGIDTRVLDKIVERLRD